MNTDTTANTFNNNLQLTGTDYSDAKHSCIN